MSSGQGPATIIDASHPGVYHIYNACIQVGTRPTLHFFNDEGRVPDVMAEDRATNVWLEYVGRRRNEWPLLEPYPQRIWEGMAEPVYYFHRLANPAHSLHDSIFSVALLGLGTGMPVPYFSHFVDCGTRPAISAEAHWDMFVHQACGLVDAGELFRDKRNLRTFVCFQHLVVPKFMRHRFAHDWRSASHWQPIHYIDQTWDYPQRTLDNLRERLFSTCFGERVVPWDDAPPKGQYQKLLLYDRNGTRCRRWSNSGEGFQWIRMRYGDRFSSMQYVSNDYELLSPAEQASLFHGADVVIAPHGGALANLIFCRPQTRIIELADRVDTVGWCTFTKRLGMRHVPFRPDSLKQHNQPSFDLPMEVFDEIVQAALFGADAGSHKRAGAIAREFSKVGSDP